MKGNKAYKVGGDSGNEMENDTAEFCRKPYWWQEAWLVGHLYSLAPSLVPRT